MLTAQIGQYLYDQWHFRVHSQYFYRGMSAKDLVDPLDPGSDPFALIQPALLQLIERLYTLLNADFEFIVHEDHSGYDFTLRDIVNWTSRDLANPGVDFTSSHEGACGYVQNFQGSQLKQNFKYITDHLPERYDDPLVQQLWTAEDQQIVYVVNRWISDESPAHQRVVIWVPRSHPSFESERQDCILRGSYEFFLQKVTEVLAQQHLPYTEEALAVVLPAADQHFDVRMTHPLPLSDIARVEIRE